MVREVLRYPDRRLKLPAAPVGRPGAAVRRLADEVTWIDVKVQQRGTVAEVLGDDAHFPFSRRVSSDRGAG